CSEPVVIRWHFFSVEKSVPGLSGREDFQQFSVAVKYVDLCLRLVLKIWNGPAVIEAVAIGSKKFRKFKYLHLKSGVAAIPGYSFYPHGVCAGWDIEKLITGLEFPAVKLILVISKSLIHKDGNNCDIFKRFTHSSLYYRYGRMLHPHHSIFVITCCPNFGL